MSQKRNLPPELRISENSMRVQSTKMLSPGELEAFRQGITAKMFFQSLVGFELLDVSASMIKNTFRLKRKLLNNHLGVDSSQ